MLSSKGQSAVEYLITYGWMLLAVAVVGALIFSVTENWSVESVSGFAGSDVVLNDFGVTSNNELGLNIRSGSGSEISVSEINISNPNTGEWVFKEFTTDSKISVGDNRIFYVPNVTRTSANNALDVEIIYSSGSLTGLVEQGTIFGGVSLTDSEVIYIGGPDDHEESGTPADMSAEDLEAYQE